MKATAGDMRLGALGERAAALERLSSGERLDLLVVGGGITGAGIALDAASRGIKVGLVERHDFGSGTSSKSSKLVHGGLRYIEQREFGLVREASMERALLTRLAPQLVETIPFVIPLASRWNKAMFGAGLWAYDALASFRNAAVHRSLDRDETEALVPSLPKGKLRGGYLFHDARSDDVRLVMEVLVQAARYGAAAWGIQFHAEVDAATVEDWIANPGEDRINPKLLRAQAERNLGAWNELGRELCRRWLVAVS